MCRPWRSDRGAAPRVLSSSLPSEDAPHRDDALSRICKRGNPHISVAPTQVGRCILLLERREDLVHHTFANVDQHVCVGEALHGPYLIPLHWRNKTIEWLSTVVLLKNLAIGDGRDAVIVELQPPSVVVRLDEREVVTTMKITGMYEDTVELVHPWLGPVRCLVQEFTQVDFEWELVTIIDLRRVELLV